MERGPRRGGRRGGGRGVEGGGGGGTGRVPSPSPTRSLPTSPRLRRGSPKRLRRGGGRGDPFVPTPFAWRTRSRSCALGGGWGGPRASPLGLPYTLTPNFARATSGRGGGGVWGLREFALDPLLSRFARATVGASLGSAGAPGRSLRTFLGSIAYTVLAPGAKVDVSPRRGARTCHPIGVAGFQSSGPSSSGSSRDVSDYPYEVDAGRA